MRHLLLFHQQRFKLFCSSFSAFKLTKIIALIADSLNISIIFGCFYTIEKSKSIPVSEPNISIGDLEMRIEKGRRNRKQWQRGDFVEPPEKPRKDFVGKKVKLRPAVGQGEESNRKPEKKKEKKKSSVAASFCAGVLAKNSKDRHVIDSCVNEYEAALKECGFREGKNGYIRDKLGWKVHCWPSTSYEATLRLNNQLKVDLVEERALKWICVNILDGDKQQNAKDLLVNHDFRVNIVTKDAVKKTTELYKKLVPNVDRPILELKQGTTMSLLYHNIHYVITVPLCPQCHYCTTMSTMSTMS